MPHSGLSRAAIFNAVEASLRRLDTDYIDLLQIHRFDPTVPPEETMKALHDLVQSGKVRYIGASSMWTYQFAMLQFVAEQKGWTKLVSMQNRCDFRQLSRLVFWKMRSSTLNADTSPMQCHIAPCVYELTNGTGIIFYIEKRSVR